ncbi:MAG: CBS domain-containing protein, partial [Nitrospiraceae bacterium]
MPNGDDKPFKTTHLIPTMVAHMMTPGVVQVPGDVSVSEAAMLLNREQAPCLLIKDTDTQFGLMTPTDIVKKVVAQGLEPHDIEVRTIMTRPVQFIEYDEALADASTLMMATG